MSTLSTHVLDLARGRPAAGVALRLFAGERLLLVGTTGGDGRCAALAAQPVAPGPHRLEFDIGAYFAATGMALPDPPFLDRVPLAFGVAEAGGHYHVPLLVSPFGYSTYRGS